MTEKDDNMKTDVTIITYFSIRGMRPDDTVASCDAKEVFDE